ncbi:MAG: ring-hydroxylating oxygenase subunit alpha [Pseudomonadota bacterium]
MTLHRDDLARLRRNFVPAAAEESFSLPAECYTDSAYLAADQEAIFARSWQFVCHGERLREPGQYFAFEIQGQPLFAVRDQAGELRAFYNVCKHRAHGLVQGAGKKRLITCPYHAWAYGLDGKLKAAPLSDHVKNFNKDEICLTSVRVEEFCGFVFVNLDQDAVPLAVQSEGLADEIHAWVPDLDQLTFAHRMTFDIKSNWKNVVDNFLECYHCPGAHKDFASLVEMDTYKVVTHGIYSSHCAKAGKVANTAYKIDDADVTDHAVWWLWPTTCLMRYPGEGNIIVLNVVPTGPETTFETYDFYFLQDQPKPSQMEAIDYLRDVLQQEDIDIVESVQRGMGTPAFDQGRFVTDPEGSGMSEHGVHHFHKLVIEAYAGAVERSGKA